MNYYVYYHEVPDHEGHDDVAICEAESLYEAIEKFKAYYLHVSETEVRKIDVYRDGFAPGIMIVSDY